jgi:integrase
MPPRHRHSPAACYGRFRWGGGSRRAFSNYPTPSGMSVARGRSLALEPILQHRALISVMTFAFPRIGAVVAMRVEDYYPKGKRWWVRLHEKGGKRHEMPAHHNLEAYLDAYIEAAGIREGGKAPLFRTAAAPPSSARAPGSAAIPSAPRASPPILKPAALWRTLKPWPRTKALAGPSSTTAQAMKSPSMKSNGLRSNG